MKRIHLGVTTIVAVTIISLAGCKKDRAPVVLVQPHPDTLWKYAPMKIETSNFYINYTYDDALNILSSILKVHNSLDTIYSILYNDVLRPVSFSCWSKGIGISETQYTLNSKGQVIRGDVYNLKMDEYNRKHYIPDTLKAYYVLTYDNLDRLFQVSYYDDQGRKNHEEFFEYTSDGNIRKVKSSVDIILEYDQFNGFAKNVKYTHLFYIEGADQLLFNSKNNPTILNGVSRTYKYNKDKYPIEMTIQNPSGSQVFNIGYYVKQEF